LFHLYKNVTSITCNTRYILTILLAIVNIMIQFWIKLLGEIHKSSQYKFIQCRLSYKTAKS